MDNMSFEELLNQTLKEIKVGQTVTGNIININSQGEIFVDLGYKADGIIPRNEFSFNENDDPRDSFKVGDRITADVVKLNDGLGNVLLSYKKANSKIVKQDFESKVKNNYVFTEKVTSVNDNGLIVDYKGIRIFIPLSLSAVPRDAKLEDYKGKEVTFRVIEYNEQARKIIGSVKAILDEQKHTKESEFWNNIEVGKLYKGTVTSLSSYGAFVDIDGVIQGLLHISGMTWERDKKPEDILKVGQEIKVKVLEFDKENKRLKLEYDKKGANPWDKFAEKYNVNDIVTVKVANLMPFGAFVKIDKGIEGLVHISQISEKRITRPEEVLKVGQKVNAKIINIDLENKKIELSIRELEGTSNELVEENTEDAGNNEIVESVEEPKAEENTAEENLITENN
ncbi:MAG: S1 RNA-binding domain-containing protein [Clostridia bacterium]|nr:S1 RNA-binding domain-containing protein [Clostridia bacterium]